jgi:cytochrome c oxidase assembly protein Cox11
LKKNKRIIGAIIIIAILLLGIGYAAISSKTLTISGSASATADDANFVVKFAKTADITIDTSKASDDASVDATITDDLKATIAVSGLKKTGEYVTATYTIENASEELSANLSAVSELTSGYEDYFKVTTSFDSTTVAAGKTTTVTVKVELIKTPTVDVNADKEENVTVTITAEPQEV